MSRQIRLKIVPAYLSFHNHVACHSSSVPTLYFLRFNRYKTSPNLRNCRCGKGQLISEGNFGVFKSPKKQPNI